jgi:AAA ATPase domain
VASLGERIRAGDAARFAGREGELERLERILDPASEIHVGFVHGDGGIGKSTLLRELGRRAEERGYEVFAVDGRELAPAPRELERALAGAATSPRPLILLDTYERIEAFGELLRSRILSRLPETTRILVAGRRPPEAGWQHDGWETATLVLPLGPLGPGDADLLLERRGIEDPRVKSDLIAWAGGSPLALTIAADGAGASPGPRIDGGPGDERTITAALVRRIVGDEVDGSHAEVLAVAAIADRVDARLLGDVLPEVDGVAASAWLRGLSFAEAVGRGTALHELARRALAAELAAEEPGHERDLRRRIADHLAGRGRAGESGRFLEFGALVRDPSIRYGFGVVGSRTHYVDGLREGDAEAAAAALGEGERGWWPGTRRWFEEVPGAVTTVRDSAGALAGFSVSVLLADAPGWAAADPALAPVFVHAEGADPGRTLVRRELYDLTHDREGAVDSPVVALINAAFARQGDLLRVERQYCVNDSRDRTTLDFNAAAGIRHLADLDHDDGGRALAYHLLEYGPEGMMEAGRALVYGDLGLAPPAARSALEADAVRDALRDFHDPLALAAGPLGSGETTAARADSARRLLREATEAEFSRSLPEQQLRATIEWGYFDADVGHDAAALKLNVSRATYFRRLAEAVERVTVRLMGP